jgi:hypothetical protein
VRLEATGEPTTGLGGAAAEDSVALRVGIGRFNDQRGEPSAAEKPSTCGSILSPTRSVIALPTNPVRVHSPRGPKSGLVSRHGPREW